MNNLKAHRYAAFLFVIGLITSQASLAQCQNPVGLDDVMADLAIGFGANPGDPQPDIVLTTRGIPTRGFIHPEGGDIGSVQCTSDYFLTYLWLGAGGTTPEERLQNLADFRAKFLEIEFFIDGLPINSADVIETDPADGFNPITGTPVAYMFLGWISEPNSLVPGFHVATIDLLFESPPGTQSSFSLPTNFEVLSVSAPAITCTGPPGCNPTGGLIVEIPPSIPIPPGTVIEQTVETHSDPRVAAGTCGTETLVLFDDDPDKPDLIIPAGTCGDPFVVITTETDLEILNDTIIVTNVPGAFFENPLECDPSIPAGTDPQMQDEVLWMGTDDALQDDGFANTTTIECGSSRGRSRGLSHNVVGMSINFGLDWTANPEAVRRAFVDRGHSKYHRLIRAVRLSKDALPRRQWRKLVGLAVIANLAYHWRWYDVANRKLTRLLKKVENSNFDTSDGYNHEGNIITRADNLRFYTDKYVIGLLH